MTHPLALSFATLLHRADLQAYEPTAEAINGLTTGFSDERKADLYALIQEAVNKDMAFVELTNTLDRCLTKNEAHFYG
jgi:hypothetical protein